MPISVCRGTVEVSLRDEVSFAIAAVLESKARVGAETSDVGLDAGAAPAVSRGVADDAALSFGFTLRL